MKKEYIKGLVSIAIFLAVGTVVSVLCWDYITALGTEEGRAGLKLMIDGLGVGGWFVTLGIQILQILVAVLPGEPVELMMGVMWGPWLGTLTCLIGIFIGTLIIFFLSRALGKPFVSLIVGEKDSRRYKFLENPVKLDTTVFILFFIPGTPKDVLTYIVPLTGINPVKYMLIATFARIPSVVTSTVIGDSFMRGDYALTIAVFLLTAVISIGGIIGGNAFVKHKSGQAHPDASENDGEETKS